MAEATNGEETAAVVGGAAADGAGVGREGGGEMAEERVALMELFSALSGDAWAVKTGWGEDGVPLARWHGVTVDAKSGRVTGISLVLNGLRGQLPAAACAALTHLQRLDLSSNEGLSGSALPETVGNWTRLREVYLTDCGLEDPLPESVGAWTELSECYLGGNHFRALPDSVAQWGTVRLVDLSGNEALEALPVSVVDGWVALRILQLRNNPRVTAAGLPFEAGAATMWGHLTQLNLSGTPITELPDTATRVLSVSCTVTLGSAPAPSHSKCALS